MNCSQKQSMKYKLVIFDFDGTLADTSEGILDAHRFALTEMGRPVPSDEELRSVIGGHLLNTYIEKFGFAEDDARKAVKIYRDRYANVGIHKIRMYPGIDELLKKLKAGGCVTAVATLKAERFAKLMLAEMGIIDLFDYICGMDEDDSQTKTSLIKKCMTCAVCNPYESVLIGDSQNDLIGAKEAGVDFIGVSYGFGFKDGKDYGVKMVERVEEIINYISCNVY